ncbi:MAG: acyltransferase family protein [Erythrobacter sp.]
MDYRRDIDGLRAVAVFPVVLYHAGVPGFPGGFVGVDVFFVISGYLITAILAREIAEGRFSLAGFYERRARRILPPLAVVLAATLLVGWHLLMPEELLRLGRATFATVLFASNVSAARSLDYFAPAAEFEPLLHTWSLAVEEQFYLIFPLLLMGLAWAGWSRRALAVVAGLSALSLAAAAALIDARPLWVFYLIVFRVWELGAGAMLALTRPAPPHARLLREGLGLAGLLAILAPVALYSAATPFPGFAALPPVLGATLLIWIGGEGGGSRASRLLALRPLVGIGLVSYSLYLWHWPILAFVRVFEGWVRISNATAAGAVAASLAAAWLSWRFMERPFRMRPPDGPSRTTVFALSAVVFGLLGALGETIH